MKSAKEIIVTVLERLLSNHKAAIDNRRSELENLKSQVVELQKLIDQLKGERHE